jgi:zinc protease
MLRFIVFIIFISLFSPAFAAQKVSLKDGNHYLALPSDTLPMVVMELSFPNRGSITDPSDLAGRAAFGAKMLMEGAGELTAFDYLKKLEDRAIEVSIRAGREETVIAIQCLSEHLEEGLKLVQLALESPQFSAGSIAKIRRESLIALKERSQSPGWLAARRFDELAFAGHALSQPHLGTEESLEAMKHADLMAWHQQLLSGKMQVSIAGKYDEDMLSERLLAIYGLLKSDSSNSAPEFAEFQLPEPSVNIMKQEVPQTVVLFGMKGLKRSDPDYYAAYVMNHILGGGGLTSRLSSEIRQEKGLAYYAGSYLATGRYSSLLMGNFATRNDAAHEAREVAQAVLQNFAQKGATKEEVQNAIDYITGSFPLNLDGLGKQVGYLSLIQRYGLSLDYLEKRNEYFRAVTLEDVNRVAAKILAQTPLIVMVGEPKETLKND